MGFAIGFKSDDAFSAADLTASGRAFGLGDEVETHDNKRFKYVLSTDTIAQYDVCAVTSSNVASRITKALADGGPNVGVAQAALSSGYYGWVQIYGLTSVNVLSTCSSSIALYTSGTAGSLDDTTTSQDKIAGITILANQTTPASAAAIISTQPFVAL